VNDTTLEYFDMSVAHDAEAMIPFIQRALARRPDMKLFLSPWSPPAWMKVPIPDATAASMLGSASPYGLRPEFRSAWALYFSKFIHAYESSYGIPFWGVTPQNEPQQHAAWEACLYDDASQAEFVTSFLGPQLRQDHPHVKIMIFDHNRGNVHLWTAGVYNRSRAILNVDRDDVHRGRKNAVNEHHDDFIDGVAFHWYDATRDLDGVRYHDHLNITYHLNPTVRDECLIE
jgi:glucosylceramidase